MNDLMVECPQGHMNPCDWQTCGECGSPLEEADTWPVDRWSHKTWVMVGAGFLAVVAVLVSAIVLVSRDDKTSDSARASTENEAILDWWSSAREPFGALEESLDDAQRALADVDRPAMESACQEMHDASAVDLPAHLPAPTQQLTSELTAALADAHEASHMCMSVLAGSRNSYDAEFPVDLQQAERHLASAQRLVSTAITNSP